MTAFSELIFLHWLALLSSLGRSLLSLGSRTACRAAGSTGDFRSTADLNKCLIEISPRYSKYATDLWDNHIRSPTELANVSVTTLAKCGVSNVAHAENIQVLLDGREPAAQRTPLLCQYGVNLKDLSEEINQVIRYTQMALQQRDWLDIYHDVIRLAKGR
ncbi:TPA: hypothetical protein ACH3X1_007997 [Trebouxia sp. C0004]